MYTRDHEIQILKESGKHRFWLSYINTQRKKKKETKKNTKTKTKIIRNKTSNSTLSQSAQEKMQMCT